METGWKEINNRLENSISIDLGYSTALKKIVSIDGDLLFVKKSTDDLTAKWIKKEISVYQLLNKYKHSYIPDLKAISPNKKGFAVEFLDIKNGWRWQENPGEERIEKTLGAMKSLVAMGESVKFPQFKTSDAFGGGVNSWSLIQNSSLDKYLFERLQTQLGKDFTHMHYESIKIAGLKYEYSRKYLVHNDINLNNTAWNNNTKQIKIIDWNWLEYGDVNIDIACFIVQAYEDQKIFPKFLLNYFDIQALTWLAGFWLYHSTQPIWAGGDNNLRNTQFRWAKKCIEFYLYK